MWRCHLLMWHPLICRCNDWQWSVHVNVVALHVFIKRSYQVTFVNYCEPWIHSTVLFILLDLCKSTTSECTFLLPVAPVRKQQLHLKISMEWFSIYFYDVFTHDLNYRRELQCRKVSLTSSHVRHGLKLILQTGVSVCVKTPCHTMSRPVQKDVCIVRLLVSHLAFPSSRSLWCIHLCVRGSVSAGWLLVPFGRYDSVYLWKQNIVLMPMKRADVFERCRSWILGNAPQLPETVINKTTCGKNRHFQGVNLGNNILGKAAWLLNSTVVWNHTEI